MAYAIRVSFKPASQAFFVERLNVETGERVASYFTKNLRVVPAPPPASQLFKNRRHGTKALDDAKLRGRAIELFCQPPAPPKPEPAIRKFWAAYRSSLVVASNAVRLNSSKPTLSVVRPPDPRRTPAEILTLYAAAIQL